MDPYLHALVSRGEGFRVDQVADLNEFARRKEMERSYLRRLDTLTHPWRRAVCALLHRWAARKEG